MLGYGPGGEIGTMIATTGCSVGSLVAVQVKGPITTVGRAGDTDRERMARYCDAFFADVAQIDAIPRHLMERLVPADIIACEFDVIEAYDQTPGPKAGSELRSGTT